MINTFVHYYLKNYSNLDTLKILDITDLFRTKFKKEIDETTSCTMCIILYHVILSIKIKQTIMVDLRNDFLNDLNTYIDIKNGIFEIVDIGHLSYSKQSADDKIDLIITDKINYNLKFNFCILFNANEKSFLNHKIIVNKEFVTKERILIFQNINY